MLNLAESAWSGAPGWGRFSDIEPGAPGFEQVGINVHVLDPGERNGLYHGEGAQEGFLVLSGECLLLIEGREQRLGQWDFVHTPAWTRHIFVGAGDGPCAILMVGARVEEESFEYPVDEVALRHRAGAERATTSPSEAYRAGARERIRASALPAGRPRRTGLRRPGATESSRAAPTACLIQLARSCSSSSSPSWMSR